MGIKEYLRLLAGLFPFLLWGNPSCLYLPVGPKLRECWRLLCNVRRWCWLHWGTPLCILRALKERVLCFLLLNPKKSFRDVLVLPQKLYLRKHRMKQPPLSAFLCCCGRPCAPAGAAPYCGSVALPVLALCFKEGLVREVKYLKM